MKSETPEIGKRIRKEIGKTEMKSAIERERERELPLGGDFVGFSSVAKNLPSSSANGGRRRERATAGGQKKRESGRDTVTNVTYLF